VGAFLEHVEKEYRLGIAHGNLDEYFNVVLDPADVRIDHRIDFTNAVLAPVIAEMIRDEASTIKGVNSVDP
jgi:RIO-like serine/threonine protein kinase